MEIPLFLAMTAGEFRRAEQLPEHPAWMACHFSAYGTGLSNLPGKLPAGSMLMLNDRTPISGHAPELVAQQLCAAAEAFSCDCILLDFQRGGSTELAPVITTVLEKAPCPVGVSSLYAGDFNCPVLLPPVPPHVPLADALAPWQDRELWLEVTAEGTEITVTPEGSRYTPLPFYLPPETAHREEELHCHYEITVAENKISFRLGRTEADQNALLAAAHACQITRGVGLWQEYR